MKKLFIVLMMLITVANMAQDVDETLISGEIEHGGFSGPVIKFISFDDQFGIMAGGRGGWLINNTFVHGGGGYGLRYDIEIDDPGFGETRFLDMGYGSLELE